MHSQVFIVPSITAEIINASAFKKYRNRPQQSGMKGRFYSVMLDFSCHVLLNGRIHLVNSK